MIVTEEQAKEVNEPILPDNCPMYGDYLYVVDGKVTRNHIHDISAWEYKHRTGANEVRRCDIFGRRRLCGAAAR